MQPDRYAELSARGHEAEPFVRLALSALEADHRELALLALADWARLGLVEPALFPALAALQRPSWGAWNGLIVALRSARKSALRSGGPGDRERVDSASTLNACLAATDAPVGPEVASALGPLAELTRSPLPRSPRWGDALGFPIALRNLVAHDAPTADDWWRQAAAALTPLIGALARGEMAVGPGPEGYPAPWFLVEAGEPHAFNGLSRDMAVAYVSKEGRRLYADDRAGDILAAFQRLLGRADAQEKDFRRLMASLAPEDIKGVLLGDYLVGRPVGRGGFASVHVGTQLSTGRRVAVKILHDGLPESARLRFQQEAAYLSRIVHASIVGVLGFGEGPWSAPRTIDLGGEEWYRDFARSRTVRSYIALEWIDGRTFEEVYRSGERAALGVRAIAHWFLQAAEALAAVHAAGLIHRDVKPSNLMALEDGSIRLMDFGIARSSDEARTLETATGESVGTPAYMSPEQIRAADAEAEVGPASDVYSLCATFYELFTGRRLFDHDVEGTQSVRARKVGGERPERPRDLARGLPWEVEVMVLGGLEPEVADRYRSAGDLARDLRHFLADEPIEYRRPSVARRLRLAYRRNRAVANLAAIFLVLAVAGLARYIWDITSEQERTIIQRDRARDEERAARAAEELAGKSEKAERRMRSLAEERLDRSRRDNLTRQMGAARNYADRDPAMAAGLLELNRDCPFDLRTFSYELLHRYVRRDLRSFWGGMSGARAAALSPDGLSLVTAGGRDRAVILWDVATGRAIRTLFAPEEQFDFNMNPADGRMAAFAPDGKTVAVGRTDGWVRLFEVGTGKPSASWKAQAKSVQAVAFTPDGTMLLAGGPTREVKVWDVKAGREAAVLAAPPGGVTTLAFSPDGKLLAGAGGELGGPSLLPRVAPIKIWNVEGWKEVGEMRGHTGRVEAVAFAPGGKTLASAGTDWNGGLRLWDVEDRKEQPRIPMPPGPVSAVAYTPDGRLLAWAGGDGTIHFWGLAERAELLALRGSAPAVSHLAFAPDGLALVAGSKSGAATLWAVGLRLERELARGPAGTMALSADGRTLAVVGAGPSIRLLDPATGKQGASFAIKTVPGSMALDRSGTLLATGRAERIKGGELRLWDPATGDLRSQTPGARGPVNAVAYSHDGKLLATSSGHAEYVGEARIAEVATGRPRAVLTGHNGPIVALAFSPDDRFLATGSMDSQVRLWDASTGRLVHTFPGTAGVASGVAFSPDGRRMAVGFSSIYDPGLVPVLKTVFGVPRNLTNLWDFEARRPLGEPLGGGQCAAFSPDGKAIALADGEPEGKRHVIRVRDPATGREIAVGRGHEDFILSLAYAPDGMTIASSGLDRTVRLWDAATLQPRAVLRGHTAEVGAVAFAPDGKSLASGGGAGDESVRLWDPSTGELRRTLSGHLGPVRSLAFAPDGRTLAAASGGFIDRGEAALWQLPAGKPLDLPDASRSPVSAVALSPDGRTLAIAGLDRQVRLIGAADRRVLATLSGFEGDVFTLAFSPDSSTLVTGGGGTASLRPNDIVGSFASELMNVAKNMVGVSRQGGEVLLWDVASARRLRSLVGHPSTVSAVAFTPDGRLLATGSQDGSVGIWDAADGRARTTFRAGGSAVLSLAFTPAADELAASAQDGAIRFFDVVTGQERMGVGGGQVGAGPIRFVPDGRGLIAAGGDGVVRVWETSPDPGWVLLRDHEGAVESVAFAPDGRTLASGGADRKVRLWDLNTGQVARTLAGLPDEVQALAFSRDGRRLAAGLGPSLTLGTAPGAAVVWDLEAGGEMIRLEGHRFPASGLAFSPDGKTIAAGGGPSDVMQQGELLLWDAGTGRRLPGPELETRKVWSVAYSPDGSTLAAASYYGAIALIDTATGKPRAAIRSGASSGWIPAIAISPDGRVLAARSNFNAIRLYDMKTAELRSQFEFGRMSGRAIAFSPDGRSLAVGDDDGTVAVLDPATGRSLQTLQDHGYAVHGVAFSPDGRRLAAGSLDGVIKVWDLARANSASPGAPSRGPE